MARKTAQPLGHVGTRGDSYPWSEWLDGDVWEIVPGEDFTCTNSSFRASVHEAAAKRGLKAQTRERAGMMYVQAIGVNGE